MPPQSTPESEPGESRSVLWLSPSAPPTALSPYLQQHGLCLQRLGAPRWPSARLAALETRASTSQGILLAGRRLAVLHSDPGEADQMAQLVRGYGAHAMVLGLRADRFDRVEAFEPDAVLVENESFYGGAWHTVRELWGHMRLRWLPMVLMPGERCARGGFATSDVSGLGVTLRGVLSAWDEVRILSLGQRSFQFPLHALGPLRTLRALLGGERPVRATFVTDQVRIAADIDGRELVALRARSLAGGAERLLDREGLQWLLACEQGVVQVEPACTGSARPPAATRDSQPASLPSSGVRPTYHADSAHARADASAALPSTRPSRSAKGRFSRSVRTFLARPRVAPLLALLTLLSLASLWALRLLGSARLLELLQRFIQL